MNLTTKPVLWISILALALLAGLGVIQAQTGSKADAVADITKLENDGVKADLAGDKTYYEKFLASDWIGGDSEGVWYTKADVIKMMSDTANNKTNSETLTDLKVRVYGNTAVATYKDTYDMLLMGKHRAHSVISTDTYVKMGGEWKLVSSHASVAK
jgi:hypothetical protein